MAKPRDKERQRLEELIARSELIRKKNDAIMAAFKRIEKHISTIQEGLNRRLARQQAAGHRLEELLKSIKELDDSIQDE